MTDKYPYKFNVTALDYHDVADYLKSLPSDNFVIGRTEMVDNLTIEEWRLVQAAAAQAESLQAGDDHKVTDETERAQLLATDSDARVEIMLRGHPATVSRRLLNRVSIQAGVNNMGINRENWSAEFRRGALSYLVQFAKKDDAILFKLAMWKRPGEDARP